MSLKYLTPKANVYFVTQQELIEDMTDEIVTEGYADVGYIGERGVGKTTLEQWHSYNIINRLYPSISEWQKWLLCFRLTGYTPLHAASTWQKVSKKQVGSLPTIGDPPVLPLYTIDDAGVHWPNVDFQHPIFKALKKIHPALRTWVRVSQLSAPDAGQVLKWMCDGFTHLVQVFKVKMYDRETETTGFMRYCNVQRKRGGRVYYHNPRKAYSKLELQASYPFPALPTNILDLKGQSHDVYRELYMPMDRQFRDIALADAVKILASNREVQQAWAALSLAEKKMLKAILTYWHAKGRHTPELVHSKRIYPHLDKHLGPTSPSARYNLMVNLAAGGFIFFERGWISLTPVAQKTYQMLKEGHLIEGEAKNHT